MTSTAITNRSIRTIKAELEFLADCSIINPADLSSILALLPSPSSANAQSGPATIPPAVVSPSPPTSALANVSLTEKQPTPYSNPYSTADPSTYQAPQPPSYTAQGPPSLAVASALYVYNPTDAGDLALLPNDRIQITEFMNADWAKGRNERTHQEGIFPRSYVNIMEEKNAPGMGMPPPGPQQNGNNYGNMPLAVSQGDGNSGSAVPSKTSENGKKFGKKLGNAAIFGAGATIGSNIVNSIF